MNDLLEFLWEGLFTIWRGFVVLMIIAAIGGAINAAWERFAHPEKPKKKKPDWRDDFR